MKKILIILMLVLSSELCFCNDNSSKLVYEMKSYFLETLKNNYGDRSANQLIFEFLSMYQEKEGKMSLVLDKEKLKKINNKLSQVNNYYRYYPSLIFAQSNDEFKRANKDSIPVIIFSPDRNVNNVTKFGVYLNYKFLSHIAKELNNEAIINIENYYHSTGIVSFFMVSDSFVKCKECLHNEYAKDFLTIVFWKYLCDLAGLDFYKFNYH